MVCRLGDRLRERRDWATTKGLIVLVAEAGDWNGASCLADALGVPPDTQAAIYREVYGDQPTRVTITTAGGATPAQPPIERSA